MRDDSVQVATQRPHSVYQFLLMLYTHLHHCNKTHSRDQDVEMLYVDKDVKSCES